MNITGTPRYDWDARYDGVQGFATQLRNRVSDPPTPQRQLSPKQPGVGGVYSPKRGSQAPRGRFSPRQNSSQRREGPPVVPTINQALGTMRTTPPEQTQPSLSTPRQLLIYDETPAGRPLPTLRDIRQANLRRVLEEEGAATLVIYVGLPTMIIGPAPGVDTWSHRTLHKVSKSRNFPIVGGVNNWGTFPRSAWQNIMITV